MQDAPPLDAPYQLLECKRRLAEAHGIVDGARAFVATYPEHPMRVRTVPFLSARDVAREEALVYRELAPGGVPFTSRAARIIGANDARDFHGISRTLFLACFADAEVMGSSYVISTSDAALADFQDDERDRARDLPQLDARIFAIDGDVAYLVEPSASAEMEFDEAFVALLGPHSTAFGHFIWHQITRLIAAMDMGELGEMPVLVDRGMPKSHHEALELAIGDRAMPIVEVGCGESVRVRRAWYCATHFNLPYLPQYDERRSWEFIATPVDRWLPILAAHARSARRIAQRGLGKRVYFSRRLELRRKLLNAAAIEDVARDHGFAIVYPEELSFAEQVACVRDAGSIAGPEGSAMFLNFYANPGAKLAILDHPYVSQLTNLTAQLEAYGLDVTLLTGTVMRANDEPGLPNFGYKHFADYEIDPRVFDAFLTGWQTDDVNRTSRIDAESSRR